MLYWITYISKRRKEDRIYFIIIGLLMILLNLFLQGTDPFYDIKENYVLLLFRL